MRKSFAAIVVAVAFFSFLLALTFSVDSAGAVVTEADYYLHPTKLSQGEYFNAEEGCTYRATLNEEAYGSFIRVEYDAYRLKGADDVPPVNERNEVEGYERIETVTIDKAGLSLYPTPSPRNYAYFDFTAHEWSAFVFTVYYDGPDGETAAYDSDIVCCRRIDDSAPEAYLSSDWVYDSGAYVFDVNVSDNHRSDLLSAHSGLKAFTVKKDGVKIDEVTDIVGSNYLYKLRVPKENGVYTMDIIDRVGNGTVTTLIEISNKSYNRDFESACDIVLTDIESGQYEDFSPIVLDEFKKKYDAYFFLVQEGAPSEEIEKAIDEVNVVARRLYELRQMWERGEKEYAVLSPNASDYFSAELTVQNSFDAYPEQKYGEKVVYTFSVAELSPKAQTKSRARSVAGIGDAETLYSIVVSTALDGETRAFDFATPLRLRIPKKMSVTAVQTSGENCRVLTVRNGSDYTEIDLVSSYGTVDIFVDGRADYTYLWSLTAIPVLAAAIVVFVLYHRKNKKEKNNNEISDRQGETKESK